MKAVGAGWVPIIPLKRGLANLDEALSGRVSRSRNELPSAASDTDASSGDDSLGLASGGESDAESMLSAGAPSSAAASVGPREVEVMEREEEPVAFEGPWVLNGISGIVHRAAWPSEAKSFGIACRPGLVLHAGYKLHPQGCFGHHLDVPAHEPGES